MATTMDMTPQRETPLIAEHRTLQAKLAPFGGWLMPIQYEGILAEHHWTRNNVCVFDICHMGEFHVQGDLASSNLDHVVTINLAGMATGQCRYGFMLNQAGGVIDDLVVYRLGEKEWMLVVNAATEENDEHHLLRNLSRDITFKNISGQTGKLDVQGPLSGVILKDLVGADVAKMAYYTFAKFKLLGEDVIVSRTGYTGELGYEIYISSAKVVELWRLLLKNSRVKPAGLGARDTLRLEMGYPLYGQDLDTQTTPVEAGLSGFVDFSKDFIGKLSLVAQKDRGPSRRLRCFQSDSRRAPRHNYKIYLKDKEIGAVTSGSFSPTLGCGIAMGYVSCELKTGEQVNLKENQIDIPARVVTRPFYKQGTAKSEEIR